MISLNDYLYSGDTVLKILHNYTNDLRNSAKANHNVIDMAHCNFLIQITELLEHNDFLTSQSQRIREFYKYMAKEYPYLAFTFKGRIKSLIRAEEKFNGYIVEYIYDYYKSHGYYPEVVDLKEQLNCFRDLIAYRIVISMPSCHIKEGENRSDVELEYLYRIADSLPEFLEERGFSAELSGMKDDLRSPKLRESIAPYYRDYILNKRPFDYKSLHITLYDNFARCYTEVQLRTKEMDDHAEIGFAKHSSYEEKQETDRARRELIKPGDNIYFDEAYERLQLLSNLDLSRLDVNMFAAIDNHLINDGCGLFRGRQILPFEHLSRFQNDLVD